VIRDAKKEKLFFGTKLWLTIYLYMRFTPQLKPKILNDSDGRVNLEIPIKAACMVQAEWAVLVSVWIMHLLEINRLRQTM